MSALIATFTCIAQINGMFGTMLTKRKNKMEYQATSSYEEELLEEVERQCDAIACELCDEAQDAELPFPFVIGFIDECGTFAELTVDEDEEYFQWFDPIRSSRWQFEGERLTAVLRSGARRPLRRFFKLRWPSEDRD